MKSKNPKCYGIDRAAYSQGKNAKYGIFVEAELAPSLTHCDYKAPQAVCTMIEVDDERKDRNG